MVEIDVGDLHAHAVELTATELVPTLADGRKIATPLDWYPCLKRASAKERANFEIMPMGIHWPDLDEDLGGIAGGVERTTAIKVRSHLVSSPYSITSSASTIHEERLRGIHCRFNLRCNRYRATACSITTPAASE